MNYLGRQEENKSFLGESGDVENSFWAMDVKNASVVARYPSGGLPPVGTPLSVDVEVDTDRNIGFGIRHMITGGIQCPNAKVAIVEAYKDNPKVLGIGLAVTDSFNMCVGTTRIQLPVEYRPTDQDWVEIQVFEERMPNEMIRNENPTPLWRSQPLRLNTDFETGKKAGMYDEEQKANVFSAGPLADITQSLSGLGKLAVGGLAVYFIWANRDTVNAATKKFSNHLKK